MRKIANQGSLRTRYGKWTVLEVLPKGRQGKDCRCRCDCGSESIIPATTLRANRSTQCMNCAKNIKRFPNGKYNHENFMGKRFGKLVIVGFGEVTRNDGTLYICRCDCGYEKGYCGSKLKAGRIKQCRFCAAVERSTKHGHYNKPEYKIWQAIKSRCLNPKDKQYPNYGQRGISIYPEWADDFQVFFEAVGERPLEGLTLDRIDNNKGYEPGNVRWVTHRVNCNNTRRNRIFEKDGKQYTVRQLADLFQVPYSTMNWLLLRYGIDHVFENHPQKNFTKII